MPFCSLQSIIFSDKFKYLHRSLKRLRVHSSRRRGQVAYMCFLFWGCNASEEKNVWLQFDPNTDKPVCEDLGLIDYHLRLDVSIYQNANVLTRNLCHIIRYLPHIPKVIGSKPVSATTEAAPDHWFRAAFITIKAIFDPMHINYCPSFTPVSVKLEIQISVILSNNLQSRIASTNICQVRMKLTGCQQRNISTFVVLLQIPMMKPSVFTNNTGFVIFGSYKSGI